MFLGKFLVGDGIQKMYRILIVEDDFRIADAIKDKMKMWDLDLHIVESTYCFA